MFTDQEIRTAMDGLVKQKGENHRGQPTFINQFTGKGECFLGALCEYMGKAIPLSGTSANQVLGKGMVSERMGVGFQVAMALNDNQFEWKYVLKGVDLALTKDYQPKPAQCPCGCDATGTVSQIMDEVKHLRALDKSKMSKGPLPQMTYASGGIIKPIEKITISIDGAHFQTFSQAFSEFSKGMVTATNTISKITVTAPVEAKKDHALVA